MNSKLFSRTLGLTLAVANLACTAALANPPGATPHASAPAAGHPSGPSGSMGHFNPPQHGSGPSGSNYHPTPYQHPPTSHPMDRSTNYRPNDDRTQGSHSPSFHQTPTKYRTNDSDRPSDSHAVDSHTLHGIINGRIADHRFYSEVSAFHQDRSTIVLNRVYALRPVLYHGYWGGGWYHGYWHAYWAAQPWFWYGGYYGFWLSVAAASVFVAETAPGVCGYWNGYAWVPYWNPPYTPYYCPY